MDSEPGTFHPASSGQQRPPISGQPGLPIYRAAGAPLKATQRWLLTAAIVLGSALGAVVLAVVGFVFYALYSISGAGHNNQAEADLQPILAQVQNLGGKAICDDGDNGYGLDNTQPWYEIYYFMPSTKSLTSSIENIAASQGYTLTTDKSTITRLKSGQVQGQEYSPASDHLVAQKGGASLSVTINRDTSVALNCSTGTYGRLQDTDGKAIIDILLTLPSTN